MIERHEKRRSCEAALVPSKLQEWLVVDSVLEAHGLAKVYRGGSTPALDGIDLAIPRGSVTALVGPNGTGKSTLMKAWMGFERPTRGDVSSHGFDPFRSRRDVLSKVGYIPQSVALYREFTVAEHLELAARLRPSFDRSVARQRLAELGIPVDRLASRLSGGQQSQVQLALVLASGAETYLLDEPLAALDPLARREFLYLLVKSLRERGGTAVLTSHVATDVEQAADRIVVLGAGHKILDAEVAQTLASHRMIRGDVPRSPAIRPIASYLGLNGIETLVEMDSGSPATTELRPPTVEELMLGYLAVGRPGMVDALRTTGTGA
jgi:ABC-2 type transport system ATP-binding protein